VAGGAIRNRMSGDSPLEDPESLAVRARVLDRLRETLAGFSEKGLPSPPSRKARRACARLLAVGDFRRAL